MDKNKKENTQPATKQIPKKPWRKPDMQKLQVSLDTAFSTGSVSDGMGRTSAPPP
ncbi:MAG: hypothetical protein H6657_27795 [Ardenticatenaceae bacterium]|nr:hypothetical protein [Anaerolineales bacterium]MCB8981226.1 hypothetical protein [Ardenticatenaceae bacterium]